MPSKELETENVNEACKKFVYKGEERTRVTGEAAHRIWDGFSPTFGMIQS